MPDYGSKLRIYWLQCGRKQSSARKAVALLGAIAAASVCASFVAPLARAQQEQAAGTPAVVQPGAPGQPSKRLPASTKGTLPPRSQADVEFMQGMIMHHAQAVEMTALIPSHTENKDLRSLGAESAVRSPTRSNLCSGGWRSRRCRFHGDAGICTAWIMSGQAMALMPGMLTPEQMEALRKAKGAEFDRLFLTGMIQHHDGALIMVKDLFDTAGAGQDAEVFDFATDVDNTQRAEIRIMQAMLEKNRRQERIDEASVQCWFSRGGGRGSVPHCERSGMIAQIARAPGSRAGSAEWTSASAGRGGRESICCKAGSSAPAGNDGFGRERPALQAHARAL